MFNVNTLKREMQNGIEVQSHPRQKTNDPFIKTKEQILARM
jgi:hypothetical protein